MDQLAAKKKEASGAQCEIQPIKRDGHWFTIVFPEKVGDEGDERHPKKQVKIGP